MSEATFSDTSTQNVTSGATWTSSNESAATIVPGGLATAVTPGTFTTITVDPSGRFAYAANQVSNNISAFTIEPTSGALTPVAGSPFATGVSPLSLTVDPSGRFAYVANQASDNISAFTIDPTTGAFTPAGSSAAGDSPNSVATTP